MYKKVFATAALLIALPASAAEFVVDDATANPPPDAEQLMQQFREDLLAKRAEVMAKGLTLTAEQAAKFWPAFEQFQKEQALITDAQLRASLKYGKNFQHISDAEATEYVKALLARDANINALRQKWLGKFQKLVPPKVAARAIQLDRRLGLVGQIEISARMPLVEQ
ncbi:hypothetical protein [Niveibacterium sp. SC-1]|uniref:hypothetical protein n=1 Tax=Niveibacterium sp. SC-1 TaxID=3135646 RepID=UPI00311D8718